jgi:hypothetical protein
MSSRPTVEKKKRRLIRSLRNTPPTHIDLIDYVKLRTRCTTGMAQKVILSGSIMVDSHPIGFKWEGKGGNARKVLHPYVDAKFRDRITFVNKVDSDDLRT